MTTIRYDLWSLMAALAEGLQHGGTPLQERAKDIALTLSQHSPAIQTKRENDLVVVMEYLAAIQKFHPLPDGKTVQWGSE